MDELKARLGMNSKGFDDGIKAAEAKVASFSSSTTSQFESALGGNFFGNLFTKSLGAIGLGSVATYLSSVASQVTEKFKDIQIGSIRTNLDPETYQRVRNVADKTGTSVEAVARAMEHIAKAQQDIRDGAEGSEKLIRAFGRLGVTLNDLKGSEYEKIFFKISDAMQDVELSTDKVAAIKDILGKSGSELLPFMHKGIDSNAGVSDILSPEQMKLLQGFKEQDAQSAPVLKSITNTIGVGWAGFMSSLKGIVMLPELIKDAVHQTKFGGTFPAPMVGFDRQKYRSEQAERESEQTKADQIEQRRIEQQTAAEAKRQADVDESSQRYQQQQDDIIATEKAKKDKELQEKLFDAQIQNMNPSERLKALLGAKDAADRAQSFQLEDPTIQQQIESAQLQAKIKQAQDAVNSIGSGRSFDSLAAIGGFTSGSGSSDLVGMTREQLAEVKDMVRTLKRIEGQGGLW